MLRVETFLNSFFNIQVQDASYFMGLLRAKMTELGGEISKINEDIVSMKKEQSSFLTYDKRVKETAQELAGEWQSFDLNFNTNQRQRILKAFVYFLIIFRGLFNMPFPALSQDTTQKVITEWVYSDEGCHRLLYFMDWFLALSLENSRR